ncbi:hypothetical protein ACOSOMT5_P2464 [Acidiphilium sp. MT5]
MARRSNGSEAVLLLLAMAIGGPTALVVWFLDSPLQVQVPIAIGAIAVLALIGRSLRNVRKQRDRKRAEYRQILLDFRWREAMSPTEFERCCADYLRLKGWEASQTKGSGDQGADVIARKNNHFLIVQCKKYNKPVGNKAVQEVIAARIYYRGTSAIVVSNQTYTQSARDLAKMSGVLLLHFTELRNLERFLGFRNPN